MDPLVARPLMKRHSIYCAGCGLKFIQVAKANFYCSLRCKLKSYTEASEAGCWLWVGTFGNRGYGMLAVDRYPQLAHRLAYECWKGSIPDGLVIDHLCRTRACINPDHLEAITSGENTRRSIGHKSSVGRDRTHCRRGHPFTEENTIRCRGAARVCRTCHNADQVARNRRKNHGSVDRFVD